MKRGVAVRIAAADLLHRVLIEGAYSNIVVRTGTSGLDDRDRRTDDATDETGNGHRLATEPDAASQLRAAKARVVDDREDSEDEVDDRQKPERDRRDPERGPRARRLDVQRDGQLFDRLACLDFEYLLSLDFAASPDTLLNLVTAERLPDQALLRFLPLIREERQDGVADLDLVTDVQGG